jgi:hypothetical protein
MPRSAIHMIRDNGSTAGRSAQTRGAVRSWRLARRRDWLIRPRDKARAWVLRMRLFRVVALMSIVAGGLIVSSVAPARADWHGERWHYGWYNRPWRGWGPGYYYYRPPVYYVPPPPVVYAPPPPVYYTPGVSFGLTIR